MDSLNIDPYDKKIQYSKHPCAHRNGIRYIKNFLGGYHMNLVEDNKLMSIVGSVVK